MHTNKELASAVAVVNFGCDTFAFRKFYELELDKSKQQTIMSFVKANITSKSRIFQTLKQEIDKQEFLTSDYYDKKKCSGKFRGAYAPVIYKTFAGILAAVS